MVLVHVDRSDLPDDFTLNQAGINGTLWVRLEPLMEAIETAWPPRKCNLSMEGACRPRLSMERAIKRVDFDLIKPALCHDRCGRSFYARGEVT